jgi:soluble lytic murein transglycosylase-like protein
MSTQALGGLPATATAGALALAQRVQQLQALIESAGNVAGGADFASALQAASAADGASAGAPAAVPATYAAAAPYAADAPYDSAALEGPTALQSALAGANTAETAGSGLQSALAGANTAEAAGSGDYEALVDQAAARNGIEPSLLHGLIQQESGFDPSATSSAGAQGLTQLMPSTASSLGVSDPLDPAESIEGGARYLGELMRQFGGDANDALAAYNAGPGAVQEYAGVPPYSETENYVSDVLANAATYRQSHPETTGALT